MGFKNKLTIQHVFCHFLSVIALGTAEAHWQDVPVLTHGTVMSSQSRFPLAHQQFDQKTQVLCVSNSSSKPGRVVCNEGIDSQFYGHDASALQQTNSADTLSTGKQILSAGQKRRVDVLFVS